MPTVSPVLRKSKVNAKGTAPIYLRFSDRSRSVYKSLGVRIRPADWNERSGKVRKSHPDHSELNALIRAHVAQASTEAVKMKMPGANGHAAEPTAADLREAVAPTGSVLDFFDFAEHVASDHDDRGSVQRAQKTRCVARRLREVTGGGPLPFERITPALLRRFETLLLTKYDNQPNTVRAMLAALRAVLYRAIREGHASQADNPFFTFKPVKGTQPDRSKLTPEELQAVEALPLKPGSLIWRVRAYFLFSFYSAGIRFGDLARLRWEHITEEPDTTAPGGTGLRLSYRMSKTAGLKSLRLLPQARAVLEAFPPREVKGEPSPYLFPILEGYDTSTARKMRSALSSQTALANKYLKKIGAQAGVSCKLTTHTARHSFADIARRRGWDVYSISKALGHANIKVTETYLRGFDTSALDSKMQDLFGPSATEETDGED